MTFGNKTNYFKSMKNIFLENVIDWLLLPPTLPPTFFPSDLYIKGERDFLQLVPHFSPYRWFSPASEIRRIFVHLKRKSMNVMVWVVWLTA